MFQIQIVIDSSLTLRMTVGVKASNRFFANAQNDRGQLNDRKQGGRLKSRFSDRPLLWPHAPLGAVALATEGLKRSFI